MFHHSVATKVGQPTVGPGLGNQPWVRAATTATPEERLRHPARHPGCLRPERAENRSNDLGPPDRTAAPTLRLRGPDPRGNAEQLRPYSRRLAASMTYARAPSRGCHARFGHSITTCSWRWRYHHPADVFPAGVLPYQRNPRRRHRVDKRLAHFVLGYDLCDRRRRAVLQH